MTATRSSNPRLAAASQNASRASDAKSAANCLDAAFSVVHKNSDSFHFTGQTNGFFLAVVHIERMVQSCGRLDFDPRSKFLRPRLNAWRSPGVLQLAINCWRNEHFLKQSWEDFDNLALDEIV
jgi:hypothetical protein